MPSFILMGSQFTSEEIIFVGSEMRKHQQCRMRMALEEKKDFLMCVCLHEYWFKGKKSEKKKKNFIIKWMELNINGKFEKKSNMQILKCFYSQKVSHRTLHGFILLLCQNVNTFFYFKSSSLSWEWDHWDGLAHMTREIFLLMSNISWKIVLVQRPHRHFLFYLLSYYLDSRKSRGRTSKEFR